MCSDSSPDTRQPQASAYGWYKECVEVAAVPETCCFHCVSPGHVLTGTATREGAVCKRSPKVGLTWLYRYLLCPSIYPW